MPTILITGATDGLGKALALLLSQKDYRLILTGRNPEKMMKLIEEINMDNVLYYECFDVLDEHAQEKFENHISQFDIDILINNAGANIKKEAVSEQDIQNFKDMMLINCTSPLKLIQCLYPQMKARKKGYIINVLSSCCKFTNLNMGGYTASKNAFEALAVSLSKEAREDFIKVLNVYPGGINTNFREIPNETYLNPLTVAQAIINTIELPEEAFMHELVIRPQSESNY